MQPPNTESAPAIWVTGCTSPNGTRPLHAFVAVQAPTRAAAGALLQPWLSAQMPGFRPAGEMIALDDWLQDHFDNWDLQAILPQLGPRSPVVATPVDALRPTPQVPDWLHLSDPVQVAFLDAQFGVHPKRSVPQALEAPLWDGAAGTYAVLDAAALPMLPEQLASSGLEHDCLFEGRTRDDLGDAAPWLVRLSPEASFTRALFTGSAVPGGMADKLGGIFLRTEAPFAAVKAHLRQFVRLPDGQDGWLYFRFWTGPYLFALLEACAGGEMPAFSRFMASRKAMIDRVGYLGRNATWHDACRIAQVPAPSAPLVASDDLRARFRQVRHRIFVARLVEHLNTAQPGPRAPVTAAGAEALIWTAAQHGVTLEKPIADFALACTLAAQDVTQTAWFRSLLARNLHQSDLARLMLEHCRAQGAANHPPPAAAPAQHTGAT